MLGERAFVLVSWNLEQVPGWNYHPNDVSELIESELLGRIPHYKPEVSILPLSEVEVLDRPIRVLHTKEDELEPDFDEMCEGYIHDTQ